MSILKKDEPTKVGQHKFHWNFGKHKLLSKYLKTENLDRNCLGFATAHDYLDELKEKDKYRAVAEAVIRKHGTFMFLAYPTLSDSEAVSILSKDAVKVSEFLEKNGGEKAVEYIYFLADKIFPNVDFYITSNNTGKSYERHKSCSD